MLLKCLILFSGLLGALEPTPSRHELPGLPGAWLELRFTNPQCADHFYELPQATASGTLLSQKPAPGYCRGREDFISALQWSHSPRTKLREWVADPSTEDIFFAFQSISDSVLLDEICQQRLARNLPVEFVMSRDRVRNAEGKLDPLLNPSLGALTETEQSQAKIQRVRDRLARCDTNGVLSPVPGLLRGHTGTSSQNALGWFHYKIFIKNLNHPDRFSFAVGSGNLTSIGVSINHENWLFFENIPKDSDLAQHVLCLVATTRDDKAQWGRSHYQSALNDCFSAQAPAKYQARGLRSFLVPGQGQDAIDSVLVPGFSQSRDILMMAHLFGYQQLFGRGLTCAAQKKPASSCRKSQDEVPAFASSIGGSRVRLIVDDDIHWIRQGLTNEDGKVGFNDPWEARNVAKVEEAGVGVRYAQTNHQDSFIQLQHNKIILFDGQKSPFVWTGAGNFTQSAMHSNFENYYAISLPSVVEAYRQQLNQFWNEQATGAAGMPLEDAVPLENLPAPAP